VQVGGNDGVVKELSLFWTEIVTADNVQVIVPNGSVWGQPLKNLSTYAAPPAISEVRFPAPAGDVLAARDRIEEIVKGNAGVAKDPAPAVLLDRAGADNALQIVATFAPSGTAAEVKSEIIKAVHEAVEAV
jgi:small conductance mechanosensitive channel